MTKLIDWNAATWGEIGRYIVKQMEGREDDDDFLRVLAEKAVCSVRKREVEIDPDNPKKKPQQSALSRINREILDKYPRKSSEAPNYWYDGKGQQDQDNWRHNIFKYLTLGRGIKLIPNQEIESPEVLEQPTKQPTKQPTEQPTEQTLPTFEDMTIDQLELDGETQQILEKALDQSGMTLPDFIRQAVRVYAKTITGKQKKQGEDLSPVPTDKLLSDPTYSTHPGRAEELTKRAIRAIASYNTNIATENADRWMITQSAIASLTGSRQNAIKEIMPKYQTTIDDNNNRPEWQLNPYSNRKPGKKIEEIINLSELARDGLD